MISNKAGFVFASPLPLLLAALLAGVPVLGACTGGGEGSETGEVAPAEAGDVAGGAPVTGAGTGAGEAATSAGDEEEGAGAARALAAEGSAPSGAHLAETAPPEIPEQMAPCAGCHFAVVESYLGHGMAGSLGDLSTPADLPEPGQVANPLSGAIYRIEVEGGGAWLIGTSAQGGLRRQRLVGRIGAGVFDVSWVGEEIDPWSGEATGRLFFAPVETVTGHGLELSPFELHPGSPGLDMALTGDCLTCHTTDRLAGEERADLPGASLAPDGGSVYPPNALGGGAFDHLRPIGCEGCHGDTSRHLAIATGQAPPAPEEGLGVRRTAERTALEQRQICARCHLQGEARMELGDGVPDGLFDRDAVSGDRAGNRPLAGEIPVLVPSRRIDGFRFVGQVEQLALALCFRASPEMTCITCHDPHTAVAAQGTASFDRACMGCHGGGAVQGAAPHRACSRAPELTVEEVAGRPPRSEAGCVDCHVPRAQPVDLPHIETADHHVRRHLPPRLEPPPHRHALDPGGPVEVYVDPHDRALARTLATSAGERWVAGVEALGLASLGRLEEAEERFDLFPAPGTPEARDSRAPEGLEAVETSPLFHHLRATVLQARGRVAEALAAYGDALALDPHRAAARMGRARLRFDTGDLPGMVEDTEVVIQAHPEAEAPWLLRGEMALRLGRPDMALRAFEAAAERWPSNAAVWRQLARLRGEMGRDAEARQALERAEALEPGRAGR